MQGKIIVAAATAALGVVSSQSDAALIYWNGGAGSLTSQNYVTATNATLLTPTSADELHIGKAGTASTSTPGLTFSRLRVGHDVTTTPTATLGAGTVTVNGGGTITLGGAAGIGNAGLTVGNTQNGTLNLDGAGTKITVGRLIAIGAANNQANRKGTVNITNGASLIASDGNIAVGESIANTATNNGMQGELNITNGSVSVLGGGADLNIGMRGSKATVTLGTGSISVNDDIEIGGSTSAGSVNVNTGSSFTITGGTSTNGGEVYIGRGRSVNASLNISGTGAMSVGGSVLMGAGDGTLGVSATGVAVNHSAGSLTLTTAGKDVRIADAFTSATSDATYNLSGTGSLTSPGGMIVGVQGVGKMLQTGGSASLSGPLTIANNAGTASPIATSGLYEISAGSLGVTNGAGVALNIGVTNAGEFRVIGDDSTISLTGSFATTTAGSALSFATEAGDTLTEILVNGTATFAAGTILNFDTTNAAPGQMSYDVLTATSITDNGLTFNGPAGWSYQIISGGNGQILQLVPEPGTLGVVATAGLALLRRRRAAQR